MKKRIAYVGLSTPIGYDYKNKASRTKADTATSPNPLLDSPFSLFLLFDEIWFLSRSLCPENLREAPFVKFVEEMPQFSLRQLKSSTLKDKLKQMEREISSSILYSISNDFRSLVESLNLDWEIHLDNHTHSLEIDGEMFNGNPTLDNLLLDMETIGLFEEDVELITNTFTHRWLEGQVSSFPELEYTQTIVIDNIPNFLTPSGPYHPSVDEARENSYLKDFRKWIVQQPKHKDSNELMEIKKEVQEALRKSQDEIFLKSFDPKTHYKSVGKAILGDAVGLVIPGASTVGSIVEESRSFLSNKDIRWQAFVVSLRKISENYILRK